MRACVRVIREADEPPREIQLDGLVLGFGAGIVFMLLYRLLELFGADVLQPSSAVAVMLVFRALGQLLGTRRHTADDDS